MSFLNCPATVVGAVLVSLFAASANAEPARTVRGSVEGGRDGEPVWVGVFGHEAAEGSWTEATGAHFEVVLRPGERATLLVVSKNRVPLTVPVADDSPSTVALRLAAGLELAGTVRSEEGAPLADAEITIEAAESDGFEVPSLAAPRWRSDRRGRFRIGGLRAGDHVVTLTADGHVPLTLEDVQVREGIAVNRIEAELPVAHFIAGRVVDGDGAPMAGVDVHVFGLDESSTTTDVDGAYRLGPFRRGDRVTVFAHTPERGSTALHSAILAPRDGLVLVFRRLAILGRLVDETTGAPVRKFRLTVLSQEHGWNSPAQHVEADDGSFRFPVDGRAFAVIVKAPGYPHWFKWLTPPDGDKYDLGEIALVPGRSLSGRVVDADTGRPIAGARVKRFYPERAHAVWAMWDVNTAGGLTPAKPEDEAVPLRHAVTGDDGTFTLHDLPVEAHVTASADAYAPKRVRLPPGISRLDFELDAVASGADGAAPALAVVIAGSIVRADGTPVSGRVNLYRAADAASAGVGHSGDSIDNGYAHENGGFRFEREDLPDGAYVLAASTDVGVVARRTVVIADGQSVEGVRLVVKEGNWLRISITGLMASEGASVTIRDQERRTVFGSGFGNGVHRVSGVPDEAVITAETGQSMHSRWLTRRIRPGDGGEAAVHLDFTARSRLTGTVTAGGRPLGLAGTVTLGGTELRVLPANSSAPRGYTHTNDQGRYDVYGLAEGPHTVRIGAHSFDVHVGQDTLFDIELPAVSLAGVVRYARTGRPVWAAEVRLRASDGYSDVARTKPDGTFRFDGLAAGEHVVHVSEPGLDSLSRTLWIMGDQVVELDLAEAAGNGREEQEQNGGEE